jgi:hypothetical protein
VREEESVVGPVIDLASIIALDTLDVATKLRGHIGEEVGEGEEHVKLMGYRVGPRVMSAIM